MHSLLQTYRRAFAGLPAEVWLLSLAALVNRSGTMVLPFLTLYATERRGMEPTVAGSVLAAYGIGSFCGIALGGRVSDVVRPLAVQIGSLLGVAVAFLVLGHLQSPWAIGAAAFAVGVIGDAFRPASAATIAAAAPAGLRTRAMTLYRLAINLGMAIGPAAGGLLAAIDYGWLFIADAATCVLATAPLFALWRRGPFVSSESHPASTAREGAKPPWRDPILVGCVVLATVVSSLFMQALSTMPLYLQHAYGLDEGRIGLLFAVNPAMIVVLEMVLVERLREHRPLPWVGFGATLVGIGFALLPFGDTYPFALLTVLVWTFGEMLTEPLLAGFVADRADPRQRGRTMGFYLLAFPIAAITAPMLGTAVYEHLGPTTLWLGSGAAGLTAGGGYLLLDRVMRRGGASPRGHLV